MGGFSLAAQVAGLEYGWDFSYSHFQDWGTQLQVGTQPQFDIHLKAPKLPDKALACNLS